jgi:hypothetical protein
MIMIRALRLASTSAFIVLAVVGGLLLPSKVFVVAQDAVNYTHDGDLLQGYIFYPDLEAIGEADVNSGNVPLVVVVPYVLTSRRAVPLLSSCLWPTAPYSPLWLICL